MRRYAVYFVPRADDPIARFGGAWLGRDIETDSLPARPEGCGLNPEVLRDVTAQPARYGFHGTLKAPFFLNATQTPEDLRAAVAVLAARLTPVQLSPLALRSLGGFFALVPAVSGAGLKHLAQACVADLDRFRAPLDEKERARRTATGLTPRQQGLLECWGYPYVAEEFRFHMTLTRRLDGAIAEEVGRELQGLAEPYLEAPLMLRDLCIVGEPEDGAPFRLIERLALKGAET